jgi:hypothetical protein
MQQEGIINVTVTKAQHDRVQQLVQPGEKPVSVAGRLAAAGFEEFDTRIFDENPLTVLAEFDAARNQGTDLASWVLSLSLDRSVLVRMRLTAKEYGKPQEDFVAMCLAKGLEAATRPQNA